MTSTVQATRQLSVREAEAQYRKADRDAIVARPLPSHTPSLPITILLAAGVIGLLKLPFGVKEIMSVAVLISVVGMSFGHLRAVWLYLLAIIPVLHLLIGLFDQPKVTAVRLLLLALLIPALVDRPTRRAIIEGLRTKTAFWFGLFIVANVIAAVVAADIEAVFRSAVYLEPLCFFLLTYSIVRSKGATFGEVLRSVTVGGWVVAISAMVEIATQRAFTDLFGIPVLPSELETISVYLTDNRFGLGGRVIGTIGQPVYAGIYFGMWAFCCGLYSVSRARLAKAFWAVSAGLAVVLLIATASRGPLTALVLAAVLFIVVSRARRRAVVVVAAMAIPASLMVLARFNEITTYLTESMTFEPNSTEASGIVGRVDLTTKLMDIFKENPFFGVGPGLIQKAGFRGEADFIALKGLENQYAMILADAGIFAGITYLMFMVKTLREIVSSQKRLASTWHRHAGVVILALFCFYFVSVASATCIALVPNYLLMAVAGGFIAEANGGS